jgi:arylsulfatase A-like enzyme
MVMRPSSARAHPFGPARRRGRIPSGLLAVALLTATAGRPVVAPARGDAPNRPNFVIVLTDDQTYESIVPTAMPYLSTRPYGHWYESDAFFNATPLCCPDRASLLTGQFSHHHGVVGNGTGHALDDTNTLATWLHDGGYSTALIGKYLNDYPWKKGDTYVPPGWDDWDVFSGDSRYYNYTLNENGSLVTFGRADADYSTDVLTQHAVSYVDAHAGSGQPFFVEVSYKGPHANITPAPRYTKVAVTTPPNSRNFNETDVSDKPAWIQSLPLLDPKAQRSRRRLQYQTLRSVDDGVEALIESLAANGVLDNTVVIFMTDNGISYGSHRWPSKACVYEECIRSPFMIRYPFGAAQVDHHLLSMVDIAPTVAELGGVTPGRVEDGTSIVPLLDQTPVTWRDALLVEWRGAHAEAGEGTTPPFWAVRTQQYIYSELDTGEKELYDLSLDPFELRNRAGLAAYSAVQADLATRLAALKAA